MTINNTSTTFFNAYIINIDIIIFPTYLISCNNYKFLKLNTNYYFKVFLLEMEISFRIHNYNYTNNRNINFFFLNPAAILIRRSKLRILECIPIVLCVTIAANRSRRNQECVMLRPPLTNQRCQEHT